MTAEDLAAATRNLGALRTRLYRVQLHPALLAHAEELAEREELRGYGAVHLASAELTEADALVTADRALIEAGQRCGLTVIDART